MPQITGQQKAILRHLANQNGYRSFKEMAKEVAVIPVKSFRAQLGKLGVMGYVKAEEGSDGLNWVITNEGLVSLRGPLQPTGQAPTPPQEPRVEQKEPVTGGREAGPALEPGAGPNGDQPKKDTLQSVGLTERQIFEEKGAILGSILPERLPLISEIIFTNGDPHNMAWVWEGLGFCNVPVDVRRVWWSSWKSYLIGAGQPPTVPPELEAEVISPKQRTPEQVAKAAESGLNYIIEEGEIVKVGPGAGDFTIQDAKDIHGANLRAQSRMAGGQTNPLEVMPALLTALTPFLKPDTDQTALTGILERLMDSNKELGEAKLAAVFNEFKASLPRPQQSASMNDQVTNFLELIKGLGAAGPIIRAMLGIPDQTVAQAGSSQALNLLDEHGQQLRINLGDLLTLKRFEADQRREDESAKAKQDFFGEVRGFMKSLGKAAEKAATS